MQILKSALAGMFLVASGSLVHANTLAAWDFETNTPADLTNNANGPAVSAETGTGTFQGAHASASSDWSTPAGPASANSYSGNTWAAGDYFQFSTTSTGFQNLLVSFDATGSSTGPRDFKIAYSTDGSTFTDFNNYSLISGVTWSSSSSYVNPVGAHFSFDFSTISALNDAPNAYFRLIEVGTISISNGTVGTAGTSRVDNISVTADALPAAPLPASALSGGVLLTFLAVRRLARNIAPKS